MYLRLQTLNNNTRMLCTRIRNIIHNFLTSMRGKKQENENNNTLALQKNVIDTSIDDL